MAESAPRSDTPAVRPTKAQRTVNIYDFRRPDKFSKEQIRTVQNMHETFARLTTTTLSASMRALVHVHVASVDQLTYEEFIRSIPTPTTLAVVSMDPLKGQAILEIDPSITFTIIDRLFGGSGEGAKLNRELTDIEHSVMEGIILRLLGNLRECWSYILDMKPRLSQIETNPMFAQIVPPSEMILLVTLETEVGEVQGMMNLCFPYMTIEPIVPKLSAQFWYSSARRPPAPATLQTLLGHLSGIDVPAELLVEGERLSLRELGALRKGSLVALPGYDRGEASFRMGGQELFRMKAQSKKRGMPQAWELLDESPQEDAAVLASVDSRAASSGLEFGIKKAMEELQAGIGSALTGIAGGIANLARKQDEMSDQLALAPSELEEAPISREAERPRPFGFVKRADPATVLNFLVSEHPQTIALVISYLEPQTASAIFGNLPADIQPEIARRIACMDRTMPEVLMEVERVLEKKLSVIASEDYLAAGGLDSIVDILNMSARSTEKLVIETLEKGYSDLAEDIKKRMFVFEDIVVLERESAEKVVRRADAELLLRAMKAAPDEVQAFIWSCLPGADLARLKGRFEELGRLRLSEVEAAQQKIVSLIRDMVEDGEIFVAHPDETVE
jgi:flagellar motor switch protein FliM